MRNALSFVASILAVALRRTIRGPRHAGWTLGFEMVNEFLARFFRRVSRLPWPDQRREWIALARPEPVCRRVRMEKATIAGLRAEWISPMGDHAEAPVILHLHGGGWAHGGVETHRSLLARLALATGARVAAPEYRLAPEHPFPAAIQDAVAVYRTLQSSGIPPARLVLSGDSAGGNLAAAALIALRDAGDPLPAAVVLICPVTDLDAQGGSITANARFDWISPESLETHAETYLAGRSRAEPLASPLRAELKGLPAMLVQVGGAELLLDQARAFAEKAQAASVDVTLDVFAGMTHVWHTLAAVTPESGRAFASIGEFVRRQLAGASRSLETERSARSAVRGAAQTGTIEG